MRLLRMHRPRIVLTSDPTTPYRDHRDHRIVGRLTMDAVYPYARDHLSYPHLLDEGLEPHKVQEVWFWGSKQANHRIDVTETFDLKMAALRAPGRTVGVRSRADWLRLRMVGVSVDQDECTVYVKH